MSKKIAVVEPEGRRKVFHLLHGQQFGVTWAHRVHYAGNCGKGAPTKYIAFIQPDNGSEIHLEIDPRDQRVLVVFDGALLPNGLPRGSDILWRIPRWLRVFEGKAYKQRSTDSEPEKVCDFLPWHEGIDKEDGKDYASIKIHRYIVLMKSRTAAFVRFDHNRLAPYYVLINVEKDGPEATVTCLSSSRS